MFLVKEHPEGFRDFYTRLEMRVHLLAISPPSNKTSESKNDY